MLRIKQQIAARVEGLEGTAEALTGADGKVLAYLEDGINFTPDTFRQNPKGSGMGKLKTLLGKKSGTLSFMALLQGSGIATKAPEYSKFLSACGLVEKKLSKITIGAVTTPPFLHGETVTGGTSGGKAMVIKNTADGITTLYFVVISGTLQNSEVLTGGTSGATATTGSAPAVAGVVWLPAYSNADIPSLTIGHNEDGLLKTIKGSRGKVTFNMPHEDVAVGMNFEFQGALSEITDDDMMDIACDSSLPLPASFLGVNFKIGGYAALIHTLSIDVNSTVSPRIDKNEESGLLSYRITDMDITGSLQCEMVSIATNDFFGDWLDDQNELEMICEIGATPNQYTLYAPRIQYTNLEMADQDGQTALNATLQMNASCPGKNDQFCLIQL